MRHHPHRRHPHRRGAVVLVDTSPSADLALSALLLAALVLTAGLVMTMQ